MLRQAQLILLLFYYRLHVSTYIQFIFRAFWQKSPYMLCVLGSYHVHRDKIHKYIKCTAPVRHSETSTILTNINILCIYVFYLYEHDGIPTCIAFTDSPVKNAWRWRVCRSKHVACNKTTIKSFVPDVPLFYFISTILAHRDIFRQINGLFAFTLQSW